MDHFNENFPKKRVKANNNRNRVVVSSPEISALKNQVDASYTIFRVRRDDASEQSYKTLKSRSKENLKIINAEVKERKSVNVNSNLSTHTLCDHFANVAMKYTPENPDQNESPQSYAKNTATSDYSSMMLTDTTAQEIMTLVHGMKEKNSVDIYDFSISLLKKIIHAVAVPLSIIINQCFEQEVFTVGRS
ncbi:hypothetical protein HHI36_021813 [Cryptolaemus montrouzieri]|uniref:Uncharacterized protein n=1 Tax=Cryptolaemus montrouzieri TaxID=559131 RepID=A0ABD2MYP7_9CUCU